MDIASTRIAVLGAGNIGGAIARGLAASGLMAPDRIMLTRRSEAGLKAFRTAGFRTSTSNAEALGACGLIILAVTPQQLNDLLAGIVGTTLGVVGHEPNATERGTNS